jgi:hypothetical protein
MIWKIWKQNYLNNEMIWKIWKKAKLNSDKIWIMWKKIGKDMENMEEKSVE